ncbi:MAG: hypothetical protein MI974_11210 [Chitinophagales bacterium]|nr:hypothetical protein [Chitinophagales bacterium]
MEKSAEVIVAANLVKVVKDGTLTALNGHGSDYCVQDSFSSRIVAHDQAGQENFMCIVINQITSRRNLNYAYLQVVKNRGAGGVDGLQVEELGESLHQNGARYCQQIREGHYQASPILGVEIPKSNGETCLLGVPTVIDRLHLPINREKSGIRRPVNFNLLGYGFVPTYKKGEKGKYQFVVEKFKWKKLKTKLKLITRKTV